VHFDFQICSKFKHKIRTVTTHVSWSVSLCVCLLVMAASFAKMAEPIEMPFGMWAHCMGPRNHVLGRGQIPPWERALGMPRLAQG